MKCPSPVPHRQEEFYCTEVGASCCYGAQPYHTHLTCSQLLGMFVYSLFVALTVKIEGKKRGRWSNFLCINLARYKMGKMDFYAQMYFSPPGRWQLLYQGMGVLKERDEVQSSRLFPCFPELQRDQRKLDMNWLFWLMLVIGQGPGGSCMS